MEAFEQQVRAYNLGSVKPVATHIAMLVSDVGASAAFYSNILGLKQLFRPDFDRHGAWFSMGSVELHLIKGGPTSHVGRDHLVVGHIAMEVENIDAVEAALNHLEYPYQQNVTVPKVAVKAGEGTNDTTDMKKVLKQFFLRDPDGYYIEVCNCSTGHQTIPEAPRLDQDEADTLLQISLQMATLAGELDKQLGELAATHKQLPIAEIALKLGGVAAEQADPQILQKLIKRTNIYGDLFQADSERGIERTLRCSGNRLPLAMTICQIKHYNETLCKAPGFFEKGAKVIPGNTLKLTTHRGSKRPSMRGAFGARLG